MNIPDLLLEKKERKEMRKTLSSKIFYSTLAVGFLLILAVDFYSSSEVSHSFSSISFLEDKKNTLEVDQVN